MTLERRERTVRFVEITLEQIAGGRCRVKVELDRRLNPALRQRYFGTAEDEGSASGGLRCAARATLEALRRVVGASERELSFRDLKTVKVFDEPAVVVAVQAQRRDERRRLVGFCLVEDGAQPRAAALAVLNATNRFFGTG